jgi:ABC-type glycerol-3-phosphate transport system substrate-binding protein
MAYTAVESFKSHHRRERVTTQKRTCVLLVGFLLVGGILYAGGADEAAVPEGPVAIRYWHDWAPEGAQGLVLQKMVDEFNAEKEGEIELSLVFMGKKRNEKIAAGLAAGEPPDVAWISGAGEKYYDAGQLVDMSRVYDAGIIDRNDVLPGLLKNQQYLGKDISIPHENSSLAVYYNKKMLQEKGMAFPSEVPGEYTWDQFIKDAHAFTDVDKGEYGWHPRWSTAVLSAMIYSAGGQHFSADGKKNMLVSDPKSQAAAIKALRRYHRFLWVDPITANDVGDQGFNNGDMAFEITGPWAMPRYLKPQGKFEPGEIGVAPFPADEDTGLSVSYWYQKALALFNTTTAEEEATLQFISWFYSAPVHAQWCAEASYLPVTRSAMEHPIWKANEQENPWVRVFLDQVSTMRRRPSGLPAGDLNKLRDIVRFQEGTPEEALKVYQKDAQERLDEFWSMR